VQVWGKYTLHEAVSITHCYPESTAKLDSTDGYAATVCFFTAVPDTPLVAVAPLAHLVCDRCKCHDAWELLYVAHE
jgi:hypothetical protein